MTIMLFSVYLLSSVFAIRAFFRKNFVSLLRLAITPIGFGVAWVLVAHDDFVTSGVLITLLFAALVSPLLAVISSVVHVSISLYRDTDRGSVLRHVAFNTPYESKIA